jgi:pimeloyl-ACP methyl ester carboxylesterase
MTTNELLAHRLEGEGEPLLLLNGGLMTFAAWEPVSATLRQHHQLILCDLRGQLLSPGAAPSDLAGNIPDLTALLDHLDIDSAHVLGTSYGAEIGLLLAALEPARVRSLIAVTATDYATMDMRSGADELRQLLGDGSEPEGRGKFHDRLVADVYSDSFKQRYATELAARRAQVIAMPDGWFADLGGILTASERFDLRPHLSSVRCPTLIVIAAADRVMASERSRALAEAIPQAETAVHETSGHALVAEDPAWLAGIARQFLAGHTDATSPQLPFH